MYASLLVLVCGVGLACGATCGVPTIKPYEGNSYAADMTTKVVGGREAKKGSWPWQIQMKAYGSHYCGGSILNENWVLTAGHCFDQYGTSSTSPWTLSAGSHSKSFTDSNEQTRKVSKIIRHRSYNSNKIDNDIALVKVSSPWVFNDYVAPVCLPASGMELADNQDCYTTGYGNTLGTCCSGTLKQALVPHVSASRCRSSYGTSSITSNMLCAGYDAGGHDACQGDSGGPFVCKYGGAWYLHGIVSWGNGCAKPKYFGVYSKVSNYISWISQNSI